MHRTLLAGTALVAIAQPLVLGSLAAQTVINTARTTPVVTSTANNGQPADVRIETAGSVTVTSGTAVTVDSNNNVTNAGTIAISNADNATGILVTGPRTATITNSGTIRIDETYAPTDSDNDGDLDGLFAIGTGRTAIRIDGALTGNLVHTGTIVVEGNNSAGIRANGPITGNVTHEGKTTVTGNNAVGAALGDVSGNVRLAGEITVRGGGSQGAVLAGDLGGALRVQSAITVTGYRTVPAPADVSRLDADDLLQGGSALVIEGNVAKGIIFEIAPPDAVAGSRPQVRKAGPMRSRATMTRTRTALPTRARATPASSPMARPPLCRSAARRTSPLARPRGRRAILASSWRARFWVTGSMPG